MQRESLARGWALVPILAIVGQSTSAWAESAAGVLVEQISPESAGSAAGLQPGDRLLEWKRAAAPPLNAAGASGPIRSPFDLWAVELEQAPRGAVALSGTRGAAALHVVLGAGAWGIQARPDVAPETLSTLQHSRELAENGKPDAAAEMERAAAAKALDAGDRLTACWLRLEAALTLAGARRLPEAQAELDAALAAAGGERRWAERVWHARAEALWKAEDRPGAIAAFEAALRLHEADAPDGLAVAWTLNRMARALGQLGRLDEAEERHRTALDLVQRVAPDSLLAADVLNGLGADRFDRGDFAGAEQLYRKSLALRERLAPGSVEHAGSLNNLGNVLDELGDRAEAEAAYRAAVEIKERLAPGTATLGRSLGNLGLLLIERGDLESAETFLRRAADIDEKLAPDGFDHAADLHNLGLLATKRGDFAAAEGLYRRSLAIDQKRRPGTLTIAQSLNNLGDLALQQRGQVDEAERLYSQALEIKGRVGAAQPVLRLDVEGAGASCAGTRRAGRRAATIRRGARHPAGTSPGQPALRNQPQRS